MRLVERSHHPFRYLKILKLESSSRSKIDIRVPSFLGIPSLPFFLQRPTAIQNKQIKSIQLVLKQTFNGLISRQLFVIEMSGHHHHHAQTKQSFQGSFKQMLINSTAICQEKCVRVSQEDRLTNYEKACLGKCFDKYHGIYQKNMQSLVGALKSKDNHSIYDDKF